MHLPTKYLMALMALTISRAAFGFTLMGTTFATKGWNNPSVEFHVNPANCPADVNALLEKAFDVWNGIPTVSLNLKRGSDSVATIEQVLAGTFDATPTIHCVTDMAALGLNPSVIPGVAMGFRSDGSGNILSGALVLNVQDGASANINTFDSNLTIDVITHELGHVLGLGHSADKSALMYYDASERKSPTLAQDDVDGITYLYARNELGSDAILGGCAVIGSGRKTGVPWFSILILAIPVILVALKYRRNGVSQN